MSKVILKKSSELGKVPLDTDLVYGELAINFTDEKIYFKNSSNVVKEFSVLGPEGPQGPVGDVTFTRSFLLMGA